MKIKRFALQGVRSGHWRLFTRVFQRLLVCGRPIGDALGNAWFVCHNAGPRAKAEADFRSPGNRRDARQRRALYAPHACSNFGILLVQFKGQTFSHAPQVHVSSRSCVGAAGSRAEGEVKATSLCGGRPQVACKVRHDALAVHCVPFSWLLYFIRIWHVYRRCCFSLTRCAMR